MTEREPDRYHNKAIFNRPLPSSKNPHFQNEARCPNFLVKMHGFHLHENEKSFSSKAKKLTSFSYGGPGKLGNGLLS